MKRIRLSFSIFLFFCIINCFGESVTIVKQSATEYISNHFEGTSRYWVTELKIVGEMNGKDAHFIKEIATSENNGNLTTLDLSEASFVDVDGLEEVFEGKELNKTYSSSSIYNGLRYGYHDVYKKYLGDDKYDTYYFGYHIVWEDVYPGYSQFKLVSVEKIDINSICGHFFEGCDKLTSVILPSNTTGIGKYAFAACTNLNIINITDGVRFIGDYAFQGCVKKQEIELPTGLTSIGSNAFDGCTALSSIVIPDNVKTMGSYIFQNCTGLKSAKLTDNLETVPWGLFYKCKNLKSVNIPLNCVEIQTYAFEGCGLDLIYFYDKVKQIGGNAFDGCPLKYVYITTENPPSCDTKPFFQSGEGITLFVPYGCTERYSLSPEWKDFEFILEMDPVQKYTLIYQVDGEVYQTIELAEGATIVPVPAPTKEGYTFSGWRDIPETMPANDVTVTGTFTINKYKMSYQVDGEAYKTYEVEYGSSITPEPAPTKDGYVFSGWTKIPATMPAEDVTITGTFTLLTDEDVIQITSAGQSTWCSKYDLDFTGVEGLKAYTATGYDRISGTIWLTRVYQVPANEGIFLMGNADEYHVPHKSTGTYYANLMVGTLQPITINETDGEYTNYYLSNGDSGVGFYKVNGSVDLKANRAYLPLLKGSVQAGTRFIGIEFEDDGTTSIKGLTPVLSEGEGEWYTLQGQRVAKPGKGLYIHNGKKVVIK